MIEGINSIDDCQAMVSWLDGQIKEKKTNIVNISETGEKSLAEKPTHHMEMLYRMRDELQATINVLDEERTQYKEDEDND